MKEPDVILRSLYEQSWAIVIGVNHYPNGNRHIQNLNFAVSDATHVAEKLEGLGFEVRALIDEQATRQNTVHLLADEIGPKTKENDRILFYVASPGATKEKAGKILGVTTYSGRALKWLRRRYDVALHGPAYV